MPEMMEYYNTCNDFKDFVDKYCRTHRTIPENALKLKVVQEVYIYYKSENRR